MATLAVEMERAKSAGDVKVESGFTGAVRSLENPGLELNDEWTFPQTYDVYRQKIGNNEVQYIFITLSNGNAKKFYPSTFTKSRAIYNEAQNGGLPLNTGQRAFTKGTAAEEFRKYGSVAEAMAALAGKKVKVSALDTVRTLRYGTQELQNTLIPTIDFVQ